MNNCGFGGTIEFISLGKPIACFPHFGDQIDTADLICQSNSGIYLPNTKIKVGPLKKKYDDILFTKDDVAKKFKDLLENPIYN